MLTKILTSAVLLAAKATATIFYAGVAESGGEFGVFGSVGQGLPGEFGVTYAFINEASIDTYVNTNKANTFRVAFLLERMCPIKTGLGATFNETYFTEFENAINYITNTKGAYAILDPHNYMRYNDPSAQPETGSIIGNNAADPKAATVAQFQAFWQALASRFVSNERVIFGIMNEPHDMNTQLLLQLDQAAINGIRASGAKQLIIAPGNGFTGGHSWTQAAGGDPSSEWLNQLTDPANNFAFDIHEYLDVDFSGSHLQCASNATTFLAPLTAWLQQFGFKAMITEFGAANTAQCQPFLQGIINYMAQNPEYIGWTAWAAGPLWGDNSPCCTDGQQLGSLEPGSVTSSGSPGLYQTVWIPEIQPLLPKLLQWSGISSVNGGPLSSGPGQPIVSSPPPAPTTTKTTTAPAPTPTQTVAEFGQCGGQQYTGPTVCAAPFTCQELNPFFFQCLPAS